MDENTQIHKEIGSLRLLLETAHRLRDWDSAQRICGELQHKYRLLELNTKQAEQESR